MLADEDAQSYMGRISSASSRLSIRTISHSEALSQLAINSSRFGSRTVRTREATERNLRGGDDSALLRRAPSFAGNPLTDYEREIRASVAASFTDNIEEERNEFR